MNSRFNKNNNAEENDFGFDFDRDDFSDDFDDDYDYDEQETGEANEFDDIENEFASVTASAASSAGGSQDYDDEDDFDDDMDDDMDDDYDLSDERQYSYCENDDYDSGYDDYDNDRAKAPKAPTAGTSSVVKAGTFVLLLLAVGLVAVLIYMLASGGALTSAPDEGGGGDVSSAQVHTEPEQISLCAPIDCVAVGKSINLSVSFQPQEASMQGAIWQSHNEDVATVNSSGVVTGVGKGTAYITVRTPNGTNAFIYINVIENVKVYLSPSRQTWFNFAVGDTNESKQNTVIAKYCSERLAMAGIETIIAEEDVFEKTRAWNASEAGAGCYVALHTRDDSKGGALVYYNRYRHHSTEMSARMREALLELFEGTDKECKLVSGVDKNYEEVTYTQKYDIPAILVEIGSRDSQEQAQWIIDNSEKIGHAIADGILDYFVNRQYA